MDPLLKWPGGKRSELGLILPLVPEHRRVLGPFAGGAAVALALEPEGLWLNDIETDLIDFYRAIAAARPATIATFQSLAAAWEKVGATAIDLAEPIESGSLDDLLAADKFAAAMGSAPTPWNDRHALRTLAEASLKSKRARLAKLGEKKPVPRPDRVQQRATALHAAFYTWIRDEIVGCSDPDVASAAWWFIRELCYGSMFRFNRDGKFNIPFGGASYNSKNLAIKVEAMFSPLSRNLFGRAAITSLDFRAFFSAYGQGLDDDFLFLDPPYDSEFSAYANRPFGRRDQADLANLIAQCRARTMLVIKRTDFIEDLYATLSERDPRIEISLYDHKYGYNVRGRNDRQVDHLMITTFPLPELADQAA
jgi:DNA adenine methylase